MPVIVKPATDMVPQPGDGGADVCCVDDVCGGADMSSSWGNWSVAAGAGGLSRSMSAVSAKGPSICSKRQ